MAHNHVYAICENKCMVETKTKAQIDSEALHHKEFTYVVNSNASLQYWLTNKASGTSSGGNDFTSVLIKKGSWSFTGNTTALDTIGTLCIEGEAGSSLTFTNTENALWYSSVQNNTRIDNVKITSTCTESLGHCFFNCSNLTNCYGDNTTKGDSNAFGYCSNLINCIGKGNGIVSTGRGFGFNSCSNLMNCKGKGTSNGFSNCYGFYNCKVVHGCKAESHCKSGVFYTCYASWGDSLDYSCDDTANGGFNDTTNPVD